MQICLFEDSTVPNLYPLVHTRAVYDLRLGMRSLAEMLHDAFERPRLLLHTRASVAEVTAAEHPGLPVNRVPDDEPVLFLNGRYVPANNEVLDRLRRATEPGEPARMFMQGEDVVAAWLPDGLPQDQLPDTIGPERFEGVPEESLESARLISRLWHLIEDLEATLTYDFERLAPSPNRTGAMVQDGARLVHPERIHLAPGVKIRPGAILNAESGPIYVDAEAVVMEGAIVRGPVYVGPKAQVRMGARLERVAFGATCKVGGEVHDAVLHSYSNKAHDGFLGNSYIGRWCNLGADTNTSNLKNDYGLLNLFNEHLNQFEPTGLQFLGLFMGDHSKCGINSMFNTASTVGVFCNLFGGDYQPRHIPSFVWGSPQKAVPYRLPKAFHVAEAVMARRNQTLPDADRTLLERLFAKSEPARAEFMTRHR